MSSNVGSFLGNFAQGWEQGAKIASSIRERRLRKELEEEAKKHATVDEGYDDPELWRSDITPGSEQARMLEQQTGSMGLSRAGDKYFTSVDAARQYADKFNAIEGLYGRLADVYARHGQTEKALGLRKHMFDIETQRRAAEESAKRLALMQQQQDLQVQKHQWENEDRLQKKEQQEQEQAYWHAVGKYVALLDTDPEGARRGLTAVNIAYGKPENLGKFEKQAFDANLAAANFYTAMLATGAQVLRLGGHEEANKLFAQSKIPIRVAPTGKTVNGQHIYNVVDDKGQVIAAGTANDLYMRVMSLKDAKQIEHDEKRLNIEEQKLNLMKLQARGAGGGGQAAASPSLHFFNPKEFVEVARLRGVRVDVDPETQQIIMNPQVQALVEGTIEVMRANNFTVPMQIAMDVALSHAQKMKSSSQPQQGLQSKPKTPPLNPSTPHSTGVPISRLMPEISMIAALNKELKALQQWHQTTPDPKAKARIENRIREVQDKIDKLRASLPPAKQPSR